MLGAQCPSPGCEAKGVSDSSPSPQAGAVVADGGWDPPKQGRPISHLQVSTVTHRPDPRHALQSATRSSSG